MTDLSVREAVARALAAWSDSEGQGPHFLCDLDGTPSGSGCEVTDAALAAVAAHPGLAEVLRGHRISGGYDWEDQAYTRCSTCGLIDDETAHLADVVRTWMRGVV